VFELFNPALDFRITSFQRANLLRKVYQALVLHDPLDGLHTTLELCQLGQHRVVTRRLQKFATAER
jgi:hypothetical protein